MLGETFIDFAQMILYNLLNANAITNHWYAGEWFIQVKDR